MSQKGEWKTEIRARGGRKPKLEPDERPWIGDGEDCCICDGPTRYWLHPENVPLCPAPKDCLDEYLKDPTIWDPRGLHIKKTKVLK